MSKLFCDCPDRKRLVLEGSSCVLCGFQNGTPSTLEQLTPLNMLLEAARDAERVFRRYASLHADKGTLDGYDKAISNLRHAADLSVAIRDVEASK